MNKFAFCDYYCVLELYKRLIYVLDLLTDTSFQVAIWDSFILFIDDAKKAGFDFMLLIAGMSGFVFKKKKTKQSFLKNLVDILSGGVTAMCITPMFIELLNLKMHVAIGLGYIIGRMGDQAPDLIIRLIRNKFKINPTKINTFFKDLFKK
jgi:hypothetical protein